MEPQEAISQNTIVTKKKSPLNVPFIIVIILLVASVTYIYMDITKKDTLVEEETTKEDVITQTQDSSTDEEVTATQEEPSEQTDTTTDTANIDEDLKLFDSLDLSGVEDDYNADTIKDLTE